MNKLIVIGAGGHGRVIADIARRQYEGIEIIFLDDTLVGQIIDEALVAGRISDIENFLSPGVGVIIGIGNNETRKQISHSIEPLMQNKNSHFAIVVDPSAVILRNVMIGPGTVLMPGAIVNTGSSIGAGVILNTACSVDHENQIGDFAHISPGAHLAGNVVVGEGTQVGVGCSIIPGIKVGSWSIVGAGTAVIKDIPDSVVSYGVPNRERRRFIHN